MLNFPENRSILVISSYRCGSTATCDNISKTNNCTNYNEIFHPCSPRRPINNFADFKNNYKNSRFVAKVIPNQVRTDEQKEILDYLFNNCYSIKLRRRNVFQQTLSYYLGFYTKKWNYEVDEKRKDYFVTINLESLNYCVNYIKNVNSMLDSYKCDIEVYYEDLGLINSKIRIYDKPKNIEQVKRVLSEHPAFLTKNY